MEKEIVDPSEQYTLVPLRELDLENESDLTAYFQMLTHPSNIERLIILQKTWWVKLSGQEG